MRCETAIEQMPLLIYRELPFDLEEALQCHLEICVSCRSEYETLQALHRELDREEHDVPANFLAECRRDLRSCLSDERAEANRSWWRISFVPAKGFGRVAAGVALLFTGFAAGRLIPSDALPAQLASLGSSGFEYQVRSIDSRDSGQIHLVVDEIRPRTIVGELDDSQIRSLLLTAAREATDPEVRVETVNVLGTRCSAMDVRSALLGVLQNDSEPAVRVRALEALQSWSFEPDTREVLARVVLGQGNPGLRTRAIEVLTVRPEPQVVGLLQELMSRETDARVRSKCERVLIGLNASAETF